MRWLLILVIFVAGCGVTVPDEVLPYYQKFESISGETADVSAFFVDEIEGSEGPGLRVAGKCVDGRIELSREHWDNSDDVSKEILILHELGHCVLDLPHIEDTVMSASTTSIYLDYKDDPEPFWEPLR